MQIENIINILIYNFDYKIIIKLLLVNKTINNIIKLIILPTLINIDKNVIFDNKINIKYSNIFNKYINYHEYIYKCKQLKLLELYNKYKYQYNNELITINVLNDLVLRTMPSIYTNNERNNDINTLVFFGANINIITANNFTKLINNTNNIIFQNIVIPSVIKIIGTNAFTNCNLQSIIIHDTVSEIGNNAFLNNNLVCIKIPLSVTVIKYNTFANNNLKKIILHDNIKIIEGFAFRNNKLINITIPQYCTCIDSYAFTNNLLEKIIIPSHIKYIGSYAFANNNINTVIIDEYYNKSLYYELIINNYTFCNNKITLLEINNNNAIIKLNAFTKNLLNNVILYNTIMLDGQVFDNKTQINYRYGYHNI